jgi:glutamine phosphoribosylpyrophosphate amidotransferase
VSSPTSDELLSTGASGIPGHLGADSVSWLSLASFRDALGERGWCDGCFSGEWPIARSEADDQLPLF